MGDFDVIEHSAFTVEPWCVRESRLELDVLAQSESVFALANGHVGWRANLDEGEPHGLPGSYLNGVYELRPLPYAEAGYGYPESGQTIINVTNGKLIRLLVDDEPFDVRYGWLHAHERMLDLRAGLLSREVRWESPAGRTIRIRATRLVSFTQRAIAAIRYEVEPRVAAAMDHLVDCPTDASVTAESYPDLGRVTVAVKLAPGQRLRLIKFVAYGWSAERSRPAVRDQVGAALASARRSGWDGLLAEQRAFLDDFWENADVEVDGDPRIQQAVRFALFHVLQAGARAEGQPISSKGLTGPGYDGHAFWDTETFVLPVFTYTVPHPAADALRWRQRTLPMAAERARQLRLRGAAFPWRTINGAECSGYWPAENRCDTWVLPTFRTSDQPSRRGACDASPRPDECAGDHRQSGHLGEAGGGSAVLARFHRTSGGGRRAAADRHCHGGRCGARPVPA